MLLGSNTTGGLFLSNTNFKFLGLILCCSALVIASKHAHVLAADKELSNLCPNLFPSLSRLILSNLDILVRSIDRDGTGQGLDFEILSLLPNLLDKPIIFSGGVGNPIHLLEGLRNKQIDAVATANLFNFVGDGLFNARSYLIQNGVNLAMWNNAFSEIKKEPVI